MKNSASKVGLGLIVGNEDYLATDDADHPDCLDDSNVMQEIEDLGYIVKRGTRETKSNL